jgi:hypothetical protein
MSVRQFCTVPVVLMVAVSVNYVFAKVACKTFNFSSMTAAYFAVSGAVLPYHSLPPFLLSEFFQHQE